MKSSAKSGRDARINTLSYGIADMQSRAIQSLGGANNVGEGGDVGEGGEGDDVMVIDGSRERLINSSLPDDIFTISGSTISSGGRGFFAPKKTSRGPSKQMKLCGNAVDPNAPERMNIAIADFIHSNCLPFSLAEDPKFLKVIQVAKSLGEYKPPNQRLIGNKYLDTLHGINWKEMMKTLLSEASIFGITVFGDGATIKTVPLLNVLAAGVNNSFALLDIADCTNHLAMGGMKDASNIANIITSLIAHLEGEVDEHQQKCTGIVDLVFLMVQVMCKMLDNS